MDQGLSRPRYWTTTFQNVKKDSSGWMLYALGKLQVSTTLVRSPWPVRMKSRRDASWCWRTSNESESDLCLKRWFEIGLKVSEWEKKNELWVAKWGMTDESCIAWLISKWSSKVWNRECKSIEDLWFADLFWPDAELKWNEDNWFADLFWPDAES